MKKILLPVLAAALLAGCAKESDNAGNTENGLVPIRLGAGVGYEVTSKAPVDPTDPNAANITAGIVGKNSNGDWETTISFKPSTSPQTVDFTDAQYYPNDGSTVNMYAWYPADAQSNDVVTFTKKDGTIDVMYATASGDKEDEQINLPFEHKLAQVYFTVTEDAASGVQEGLGIQSITMKSVQVPASMNISTGTVTFAAESDLTVPGFPVDIEGKTDDAAGEPIMIAPSTTKTYSLVITTTDNTQYPVSVDFTNSDGTEGLVAGTAYKVAITFGRTPITLTASVAEWKSGTASPVTIQ